METILIADDHEIVRQGIRRIIESFPKKYRLMETSTCKGVIEILSDAKVEYTILDMHLEDGNIFSTINNFTDYYNKTNILVYSMNAEKIYARRLIQKGVKGFVSKQAPMGTLEAAIRSVLNGEMYLSPWLKEALSQQSKTDQFANPIDSLSDRELEVIEYTSSGMGVKEISMRMNLEAATVSTYRRRAFDKLGVENVVELNNKLVLYKDQG
jgi:two-component system, NarL family, invasion response regulator UvrY